MSGVTPRRNPELVVVVLWENGEFSYYPARLGAEVVSAYVTKQRRLAHNLQATAPAANAPAEVGAVWTTPSPDGKSDRLHTGRFLVQDGKILAQVTPPHRAARSARKPQVASVHASRPASSPIPDSPISASPAQLAAALPARSWKGP